jgi:hypothetical protein
MDFKLVAVDPTTCALFTNAIPENHEHIISPVNARRQLPISAFQKAIKYAYADPSGILVHLAASLADTMHSSLLKSLIALATVTNIYKMLPNTTVSLEVTSHPLYKAP